MNGIVEHEPIAEELEIVVRLSFVDGDTFVQNVPVSKADLVEELLDWFRFRTKVQTYTFDYGSYRKVKVFSRHHITAIEIDNYIELSRTSYKWHEKLKDRATTWMYFLILQFKQNRRGKHG